MRIGASDAPPILFVPPLLEEMNRTRALIVSVMRRLAAQGLGCWLPDLRAPAKALKTERYSLGAIGVMTSCPPPPMSSERPAGRR
jgi:hypothetical protein